MRYGWNPSKAALNFEQHGVAFEDVEEFDWLRALVRADLGQDEKRLNALAPIGNRLHHLTFTPERRLIWVISLRKANRKEIVRYAAEVAAP